MKISLLLLLFIISNAVLAQTDDWPQTPHWDLARELKAAGLNPYERYNWSEYSLMLLLNRVPIISNLKDMTKHKKIEYKMGGENPGKSGFSTLLPSGRIYVQVYYAKHLKNIDVALTMGHELIHAMHIDSGLHDEWKKDARQSPKEYAECVSENAAYTWSRIYGSNSDRKFNDEMIEYYLDCMNRLAK